MTVSRIASTGGQEANRLFDRVALKSFRASRDHDGAVVLGAGADDGGNGGRMAHMKTRFERVKSRRSTLRWMRVFVSLGLTMSLTTYCAASATSSAERADEAVKFDEVVSHYQRCGYLNGAVLVARQGRILYERGVGEADMARHVPNTPQTRFGIASITKQFTAILVLQQVGKGNLRLDAAVCDYLPWYRKDTGRRMTIDQLLHHTAGLPPDYDAPAWCDTAEGARHREPLEFAKEFCQPELASEPGAKWAYSNSGYVLLGLILEQVTGKPYDTLLAEQILVPLGMKNTGMDHNDLAGSAGGAVGYVRHAGPRFTRGPYLDRSHVYAAGAMYSTVEDLLIWNQALSAGALLPPELQEQVFKPGLGNWACGWFVTKIPAGHPGAGRTLAEMRGDLPGNYFAWIRRYPEQDAVIIVLRNAYGSTERLEENLEAILYGQPPRLPSRSAKDIAAGAWLRSYRSIVRHPIFSAGVLALVLWSCARRCGRRARRREVLSA
jgi:CubicO group peptidase (beta-lactamase class C family)